MGDRPKRRRKSGTDVRCSLAVPVLSARVHRPYSGGTKPTCPSKEGIAAPTARPRSPVPSAATAPGTRSCCAPPTPRPRNAPLSRPAGRARSAAADDPLSRTPTAEPAADSRVRGSPSRRRPRSASRVTHRRREGAARARGGGRGASHSLPDPTPCSEPTELRRLCLAGLSLQPEP